MKVVKGFAVAMLTILIAGCTNLGEAPKPASASIEYSTEIERLETALNVNPDDAWQTHRELAALYRSHQNPSPNYEKALFHLNQYLMNDAAPKDDPELGDWQAALENLSDLRRRADKLAAQNQELNKTINILKTLDQGVEKKRKDYAE